MNNLFRKPSAEDVEKRRQARRDAREHLERIKTNAQACLADEKFTRYREQLERTQDAIVRDLIDYQNPDPIQYAMVVSNMLTELRVARTLAGKVTKDAKRGDVKP